METWKLLAATHLAVGLTGYVIAPRERLDPEVELTGLFSADTKRTLAAAVLSLRDEERLLVYTYRGVATVVAERSELAGLLSGSQQLTLPAAVGYYVDLAHFGVGNLTWDEGAAVLTVRIPPLVMGDVAFEPESALVRSGGVLSYSDRQVQELAKVNYRTARRAFIKQAQGTTLVDAANRNAREVLARHFQVALASVGLSNAAIHVTVHKTATNKGEEK